MAAMVMLSWTGSTPVRKTLGRAPVEDGLHHGDELAADLADHIGGLEVLGAVEVFAVDQRQEFRILDVVLPGEADECASASIWWQFIEVQALFRGADVCSRLLRAQR